MSEISYDEMTALHELVEPWSVFLYEVEGSEFGDQLRALEEAVGPCSSAGDYETAHMILSRVREIILSVRDDNWFVEMVERADDDHDRWLAQFSDDRKAELSKTTPRPSERFKALPDLAANASSRKDPS